MKLPRKLHISCIPLCLWLFIQLLSVKDDGRILDFLHCLQSLIEDPTVVRSKLSTSILVLSGVLAELNIPSQKKRLFYQPNFFFLALYDVLHRFYQHELRTLLASLERHDKASFDRFQTNKGLLEKMSECNLDKPSSQGGGSCKTKKPL